MSKISLRKRSHPSGSKKPNFSEENKGFLKCVNEWVKKAVERQKNDQPVFDSLDHALVTSQICNVSRRSIFNIQKCEPSKKRTRGRNKIAFDDFAKNRLSRMVLGYYKRNPPVIPTLNEIHSNLREDETFPPMSRSKLHATLKTLGFTYKGRKKKMSVYQRFDIVVSRHKFLMNMEKYRNEGYNIYYQDETWCNANHTREYVWQTETSYDLLSQISYSGGLDVPQGQGQRLIINNIGSVDGFLEGCGECFVGVKDCADYHKEMNGVHYEKWWEEKVLPKLPNKSVVLIDNAKYHTRQTEESKTPNTSWRKKEIQAWLEEKKIPFVEKETIPILLSKVKALHIVKKFRLETITEEYCAKNKKDIQIQRIPVGHSELNAIELVWAKVKTEVAKKNTTFKIKDVQKLVNEALENVTPDYWQKVIHHTLKVEDSFRKIDFGKTKTPTVEPVVIYLGSDSEDSTDESDDDDSGDDECL